MKFLGGSDRSLSAHARARGRAARHVVLAAIGALALGGLALTAGALDARVGADAAVHAQGDGEEHTELWVSGARNLAAWDATLLYDAAVISPTGVALGPFAPADSVQLAMDVRQQGRVLVGGYSSGDEAATGDGHLATVSFVRLDTRSPRLRLDRAGTGAYDAEGRSIAPPARIVIGGLAAPAVYLPLLER